MKTRKFSQLPLLVGLVVGLAALWAGSTPVAGVSGGAIGGFTRSWIDGAWVATTSSSCTYCDYTSSTSCSSYYHASCIGGYIAVAQCIGLGDTTHANGQGPCWHPSNPECTLLYDADCY